MEEMVEFKVYLEDRPFRIIRDIIEPDEDDAEFGDAEPDTHANVLVQAICDALLELECAETPFHPVTVMLPRRVLQSLREMNPETIIRVMVNLWVAKWIHKDCVERCPVDFFDPCE